MTLDHREGVLSIDRLGQGDLTETFGFLDRDPVLNVYLIALTLRDALTQSRDETWAVRRDGEIAALVHLGGQTGAILPVGDDESAIELLASRVIERLPALPARFHVIGPRMPVDRFHRALLEAGREPRVFRRQVYLSLEPGALPAFQRLSALRPATPEDYDLVFESGALLRAEELEEDPRLCDPVSYARRVEEECRDGYTHLWLDRQGLCFRASMSARTGDAVQVSGVYTPPARRGQGLARRGLSELCARLLGKSRNACLFVNDFNAPALALYEKLGFRAIAEWGSAFYDLR
jgi:GNAT superfamily N-acetyltransferase